MVKECLQVAAQHLAPEKLKLFDAVPLSRRTVTRRVEDIGNDLKNQLYAKLETTVKYSLALDESTDAVDTAQLAVFIRAVDDNFHVTEELLALCPMKGTTTGKDVFNELDKLIRTCPGLSYSKLTGITTDGAPSMVGNQNGLVGIVKKNLIEQGIDPGSVVFSHCIIHQQNICAKSLKMEEVMKVVKQVVNTIRSRGLRHRQFRTFLEELDSEYEDVPYFTEVRWLSRGRMLNRVWLLKQEITEFYSTVLQQEISDFEDEQFINDFAFLVDITTHLNILNSDLQGKNHLISDMYHNVASFHSQIELWVDQLTKGQATHFKTLRSCSNVDFVKYSELMQRLNNEFLHRFMDFKEHRQQITLFSHPRHADPSEVEGDLQLELIRLKTDPMMLTYFQPNSDILESYSMLPDERYPSLREHGLAYSCLFGSTYICEQVFSRMKYTKSKYRTRLTDQHLVDILRCSTTKMQPRLGSLASNTQQQPSH